MPRSGHKDSLEGDAMASVVTSCPPADVALEGVIAAD